MHDPTRTGIALAGSGFSLIVIFMQLGFFRATQRTATMVLDKLDFDLVVVSKDYQFFNEAGTFPIARIRSAESVPGVASATPVYVRMGLWRNLDGSTSDTPSPWRRRSILVLAYPTSKPVFLPGLPGLSDRLAGSSLGDLEIPFSLFLDDRSRPEFGPRVPGISVELNNQLFRLGGTFEMGTGFASEGAAILSDQNFARAFGDPSLDYPTLGLVKLSDPSMAESVVEKLRAILPEPPSQPESESSGPPVRADADVRVFLRSEIEQKDRLFWIFEKTIGVLFGMGILISFLVGLVVFYQVLSSDIADHLAEYATLKAIGYSNGSVALVVIAQASVLGLVGYVLALGVATGLFAYVEREVGIPMTVLDGWVLVLPMVLSQLMSTGSALVSIRKLTAADPADLFR